MPLLIDKKTLDATTKCEHKFSCIETGKCGDRPMCEMDYRNGEPVTFLKTRESASCTYRLAFTDRQVCMCPTRFAIGKTKPVGLG